jgi:lipopolysaccharide export LptBFGC system permease protein LptF
MLRCLVRRLTLYLLAQMAAALAVAVVLLCGLTWALQALRLGHHLTGALDAELVGRLLLFSLPTLLVLTLPISVGAAVLFSLGQLAETGELSASRTLGASPLQLSLPAILLTLGVSGATIAAASLEGAALRSLKESIAGGATRSLLGSIRPGGFRQLPGDVVIYVERRLSPGRFGGVMMARPGQLLLAREAVFEQEQEQGSSSVVQMRLTEGELHLVTPNRALTRVRFGELEQTLDLRRLLQRHFGFISPERRRTDTVGAAAITLALGLLATVVGLSGRRRTRVVIVGLGLVVAVQLLCWALGGPLLPGIVALGCVGWLLWISRARRS